MKAIAINAAEMEALADMPHQQIVLYLKLRWFMDRDSGLVGIRRSISYLTLSQELHVAPVRGRHGAESGSPTVKSVRNALDGLRAAGLLSPFGNGDKLIFRLPFASTALSRPNDEGQMRGRSGAGYEGQGESLDTSGFQSDEGQMRGRGLSADEGHVIRGKGNTSISVVNAAAALPVDNSDPTEMLLPLQAMMASWLSEQEKRRGKVLRVRQDDPALVEWAGRGVTMEMLATAYADALADREMQGNPHPLNVSFIGIFVGRLMAGGREASRKGSSSPRPWFVDHRSFCARAAELGMPHGVDEGRGKAFSAWRKRVLAAAGVTRDEYVVACRDMGNGRVDWQFVESVWGEQ